MVVTITPIKPTEKNTFLHTPHFLPSTSVNEEEARRASAVIGVTEIWQISQPEIYQVSLNDSNNNPVSFIYQLVTVKRKVDGLVFFIHTTNIRNVDTVITRASNKPGPMGDGMVFTTVDHQTIHRQSAVGSVMMGNATIVTISGEYVSQRKLAEQDITLLCAGISGKDKIDLIRLPNHTSSVIE